MIRAVRRQWRYVGAWLRGKQEERADPRIQLEQAIEEARRQHQLLTQQAQAVLANQHQLQIQLGRAIDDVEKLHSSTGHALRLADEARARGDAQKAGEFEQTARAFAAQLASIEGSMENMKGLHDKALASAEAARRAVQQNDMLLREKMAEKTTLLTQLEQAQMQERMNAALQSMESSVTAVPGDTPTLDEIRLKIEARYARALGAADLASTSVDARVLEVQQSMLQAKGDKRLEEIRASLNLEAPSVSVMEPRAITDGTERETPVLPDRPAGDAAQGRQGRSRSRKRTPSG